VEIIRATVDMAEDAGYVHATAWKNAYDGIVPKEFLDNFTPEKRTEAFRKILQSAEEEHYIINMDGRPMGILTIGKSRDSDAGEERGEVYGIYLLAEYWGKKYGKRLMDFAISRLKELGYSTVSLWTLEENQRARVFYEKYGFVPDGAKKELNLGKPMTVVRYVYKRPDKL